MRCYLFDIDGTLSDPAHRLHHIQRQPKDWNAFFDACSDDPPFPHMVELAIVLTRQVPIVAVSGRSDRVRIRTMDWLEWHGIFGAALYMRKDGDYRPDDVVKGELLDRILADDYEPIMAFDDRKRVVDMWRSRGIPCAQVAEGDF